MKYGLLCSTVFQGLTVSPDDIYDTKEEAEAELRDFTAECKAEWMDSYEDFHVDQITQGKDGKWRDSAGAIVTVNES